MNPYHARVLAGLASLASVAALASAAHAADWGTGGATDSTKQEGVCPGDADVTVTIGGKCAGQVDGITFKTSDTPPKSIDRGASLGVPPHSNPIGGRLSVTVVGTLPKDLDTWSGKGKSAETEDIVISHWSKGHETGYTEEFKGVLLTGDRVQTEDTKGKASATGKKVTLTTINFDYKDLVETLNGKPADATCPDKAAVLLYLGGKCLGSAQDVSFKSFDSPPKTYGRGSSLGERPKTGGELSVIIVGPLPADFDTWGKKGKSAEAEDIVIKHSSDDHLKSYELDFDGVTLKEDTSKVSLSSGAPQTTLHFAYKTLTENGRDASSSSSSATGVWGK